jgi:hypothetical protein
MGLLCGEDLPPGNDICQGHRLVILPLAHNLLALHEYNEPLAAALVEHLCVACVATSHLGFRIWEW